VSLSVRNTGVNTIYSGNVVISNDLQGEVYNVQYGDLDPQGLQQFSFKWTAPGVTQPTTLTWSAKVFVNDAETEQATATTSLLP
jgi:hypothetical protein